MPVASVTEMELDAMSDQITRIWRQEGIEVHLGTGEREPGDIHLRLVLSGYAGRRPATRTPA